MYKHDYLLRSLVVFPHENRLHPRLAKDYESNSEGEEEEGGYS